MKKSYLLLLLAPAAILLSGCASTQPATQPTQPEMNQNISMQPLPEPAAPQPEANSNQNNVMELKIETTKPGTGEQAVKAGDTVSVQYTGKLTDGTKFDSSYDHGGAPFTFTVGQGQVIKGWDQGLIGMKVGEERKLTIPGDLAYGPDGIPGTIPPNATLVFDVQLVSIK
jgi:FKBP-type peptidyl-prolyl cis-trans isomerase